MRAQNRALNLPDARTHRACDDGASGTAGGFENLSPNGRSLGAADFIGMVEMKLGRKVRLGKRGRKRTRTPDRWIDTGNSYHVPVIAIVFHSDTATENRERRHVSGDTIAKDVLVN